MFRKLQKNHYPVDSAIHLSYIRLGTHKKSTGRQYTKQIFCLALSEAGQSIFQLFRLESLVTMKHGSSFTIQTFRLGMILQPM